MANPGYPNCCTGRDSRDPQPPTRAALHDPAPPTWLCSTHPFFRRPALVRGTGTGVAVIASANGGFLDVRDATAVLSLLKP